MSHHFIYCRKSTESEEKQVLSIDSQVKELGQLCDRQGIVPSDVLTESKSAKGPGRPIFNDLLKKVSAGAVRGIVCWKLDRLARNPIDGSALVWALDQGKLTEIVTPTGTFRNNSNDKFLMQLEFGMAKKYVDDLSDNVKRGNRAKLEKGWQPNRPPLGYLNEPRERTIVPDPDRFVLVQRMWHMLLQGLRTREILRIASDEWGLRTRKSRRSGGGLISRSGLYLMFTNPFYYGLIESRQGVFQGKHEPMISEDQYWKAQEMLGRQGRPRPKRHSFPFTGLIRCGSCRSMITAEEHTNRYGYHYVYYRCTKKDRRQLCSEKYVNASALEKQILDFLSGIHVPDSFLRFGLEHLARDTAATAESRRAARQSLEEAIGIAERQLANLTRMRVRDLIEDEEFLAEKEALVREKMKLESALRDHGGKRSAEKTAAALSFGHRAREAFENGTPEEKRTILASIGSNLTLTSKKLIIEAAKPFVLLEEGLASLNERFGPLEPPNSGFDKGENEDSKAMISEWCTVVDDVRTFFEKQEVPDQGSASTDNDRLAA